MLEVNAAQQSNTTAYLYNSHASGSAYDTTETNYSDGYKFFKAPDSTPDHLHGWITGSMPEVTTAIKVGGTNYFIDSVKGSYSAARTFLNIIGKSHTGLEINGNRDILTNLYSGNVKIRQMLVGNTNASDGSNNNLTARVRTVNGSVLASNIFASVVTMSVDADGNFEDPKFAFPVQYRNTISHMLGFQNEEESGRNVIGSLFGVSNATSPIVYAGVESIDTMLRNVADDLDAEYTKMHASGAKNNIDLTADFCIFGTNVTLHYSDIKAGASYTYMNGGPDVDLDLPKFITHVQIGTVGIDLPTWFVPAASSPLHTYMINNHNKMQMTGDDLIVGVSNAIVGVGNIVKNTPLGPAIGAFVAGGIGESMPPEFKSTLGYALAYNTIGQFSDFFKDLQIQGGSFSPDYLGNSFGAFYATYKPQEINSMTYLNNNIQQPNGDTSMTPQDRGGATFTVIKGTATLTGGTAKERADLKSAISSGIIFY